MPTARIYQDPVATPIALEESTTVKSRVRDGNQWSALNEALFLTEQPATAENFAITELNYHPADPTAAELATQPPGDIDFEDDDFEFVELKNIGDETIDLSGVRFNVGIDFDFADGTMLDPEETIVVVRNPVAFQARYGSGINVAGTYTDGLRNGGENVELLDRFAQAIAAFEYNDADGWPGRADGKGATLELIAPDDVPASEPALSEYLGDPDHWRSSIAYLGTPGAEPQPHQGVVINEVLSHTDWPAVDAIELVNIGGATVDLGGWYLSDSWGWDPLVAGEDDDNYKKFRIPRRYGDRAGRVLDVRRKRLQPGAGQSAAAALRHQRGPWRRRLVDASRHGRQLDALRRSRRVRRGRPTANRGDAGPTAPAESIR